LDLVIGQESKRRGIIIRDTGNVDISEARLYTGKMRHLGLLIRAFDKIFSSPVGIMRYWSGCL
jgi:hypothetical protein